MSVMSEQESLEQRFAALQESFEQRLAAVEAENAALRARIAERGNSGARTTTRKGASMLSRRKALARLGGVAAAAGVAATAATLATNVPDAHAADGGAVIMGQTNTSTKQTTLQNDGTSGDNALLELINNGHFFNGSYWGLKVTGPAGGMGIFAEGVTTVSDNVASTGVHGTSSVGTGVHGVSDTGTGVVGTSGTGGTGVMGTSIAGLDLSAIGSGRIHQIQAISHAGPPVAGDGTFKVFEQIRDSNAMLWLSVFDPTQNLRWVRPGVVNGGALGGALNFLPSPVRIIGAGSPPGVALAKNTRTNFTLAGSAGIPLDAKAVFGNATVYGAGGSGFVTLVPKGGSASTSSLNFTSSDQPLSNFVAVGLNAGAITVTVSNNFNVKFIYDVVGYCL